MSSYQGRGLHGQAVDVIGRRIVQGEYEEGSTLDLEKLQAEQGVSLTVVREALKVLAGKGLVGARQRRGTFVQPRELWNLLDPDLLLWEVTPESLPRMLDQLAEVRAIFEPAAAALAAVRRDAADIEMMRSALAEMGSTADPADVTRADIEFHSAVLAATKNDLLRRVEMLTRSLFGERDRIVHQHVTASDALDLHGELLDAIRAQDPGGALAASERILGRAAADAMTVMSATSAHCPIPKENTIEGAR